MRKLNITVALGIFLAGFFTVNAQKTKIIHDAEYYILEAQHGKKWNAEDKGLNKKIADLKKKFGAPPNIIHIMWDDMPVGAVGIPALQKNRGFETPNINKFSEEGINFTRMYSEPSCTPSRAAVMTGRLAVRSGMYNVGFPYEYGGIGADEITMAEVLSEVGYATAFYGKSHLGDVESSYLNHQGYDEALWAPYNQVPSLYVKRGQQAVLYPASMYPEMYPTDPYEMDLGWRPKGYVWALEGLRDGPVKEWGDATDEGDYYRFDQECVDRAKVFMKKNADANKPFYFAFWPQMASFLGNQPGTPNNTISGAPVQEGYVKVDGYVGQIMAELKKLNLDENTLVVLMADNGPMAHHGPPGMVEQIYRGGKGDYLEGGSRVPCFVRWPAAIEGGQLVGDMIHLTDLFTTFASIAGATKYIPTDRIVDGIDQTAIFLNGDTHGRRDFIHIYTGNTLAATVKGRFKRVWVGEEPGLTGAAFYDLYNDPREISPKMLPGFTTKGMFNAMKIRHELWTLKYPNKEMTRDFPFKNVVNPRPDVKAASEPRVDPKDLPFDPREFIKYLNEFENTEQLWGSGER